MGDRPWTSPDEEKQPPRQPRQPGRSGKMRHGDLPLRQMPQRDVSLSAPSLPSPPSNRLKSREEKISFHTHKHLAWILQLPYI
jgi:hypothetical protein